MRPQHENRPRVAWLPLRNGKSAVDSFSGVYCNCKKIKSILLLDFVQTCLKLHGVSKRRICRHQPQVLLVTLKIRPVKIWTDGTNETWTDFKTWILKASEGCLGPMNPSLWGMKLVQVTQTFTYISNVISSSTGREPEVTPRVGQAWSWIFFQKRCLALSTLVQEDEGSCALVF